MKQELSNIFVNWEDKLQEDEWYFSSAFNDIKRRMSASEAFDYIPVIIKQILILNNDYLLWNTLYFLLSIYSIAQTTEIHSELKGNWNALSEHISDYKDSFEKPFQELKRYLRIKDSLL
jgi:hypothetical protein